MNKTELSEEVADRCRLTKTKALEVVSVLFEDVLVPEIAGGEKVMLTGFGTFAAATRKPRKARSFDGDLLQIPAKRVARFTAGKLLRDRVAGA